MKSQDSRPQKSSILSTEFSRRTFLKAAAGMGLAVAGLAGSSCSFSGEAAEQIYDGEVFDSKGTVLNLAAWGGRWEEFSWKSVLTQFERDFNCRVYYDSAPPFYPKLQASGIDYPAYDVINLHPAEALKLRNFFVSQADYQTNVPDSQYLWDSARNGTGLAWLFGKIGYAYRSDLYPAGLTGFKSLWDKKLNGKRGAYVATETIQQAFLMAASRAFGQEADDTEAGIRAFRDASPWFAAEFTSGIEAELAVGRILAAPLTDAETYWWASTGPKVEWVNWNELTAPLPQLVNVTKKSPKKRLAYALVNRLCSAEVQEKWAAEYFWHPTNRKAQIPPNLAAYGVANESDGMALLWQPDWQWWNDHEKELLEKLVQVIRP